MKVLICSDFYLNYRSKNKIYDSKFSKSFLGVFNNYLHDADLKVLNLESPVTNSNNKINKHGVSMKMEPEIINTLKSLGFNLLCLANNHFFDYGQQGVVDTIDTCIKNNIGYVGGGKNLLESIKPYIFTQNNFELAIVNICEEEFNHANQNHGGSNNFDIIDTYKLIKDLKNKYKNIIVISHGGNEHYQYPNPKMKKDFRFLVDAGASVVINHHQHCYSGYEIYNESPIFYGLGNFYFDKGPNFSETWHDGYSVILDFRKKLIDFEIIPFEQCNIEPIINSNEVIKSRILSKVKTINEIICDDSLLSNEWEKFCQKKKRTYEKIFQPYKNKYLIAAYKRNLIPDFKTFSFYQEIRHFITCNAHLEVLKNIFRKYN